MCVTALNNCCLARVDGFPRYPADSVIGVLGAEYGCLYGCLIIGTHGASTPEKVRLPNVAWRDKGAPKSARRDVVRVKTPPKCAGGNIDWYRVAQALEQRA